jgi:hypothetical protein
MNGSWGYNASDNNYKSSKTIIQEMVKTVSRDGNYLLNIGPKGDGTMTNQSIAILNDFGTWMDTYSESIYGTTRSPYSVEPGWGFYTKKQGKLYAHVFAWPANRILNVPSLANSINKIYLLNDTTGVLAFTKNNDSITISMPLSAPNATNSVVVLDVVGVPSASTQGTGVDILPAKLLPHTLALNQNYPNPFNPSTTITFTLAEDSRASLKVFDILGREVALLVNGNFKAGELHSVLFDASRLSAGIYFYRLETNKTSLVKKLVLLK